MENWDRRISREDVLARFRLTEILERDGVKINAQNKALCPFHNEKSPSFDVNPEKQMFYCFGCNKGGTVIDYLAAKGSESPTVVFKKLVELMSASPPGGEERRNLGRVVAYYVYRSATGEELCRKVRYDPKDFRIERKKAGNWIPGLADVQRVLYNLPEILSAKPEDCIFICEGEKDCDNVGKLGWIATTNIDGAGKWMDGYNEALSRRDVVICPDNDKAGREHLQKVLDSLDGKCKRLRVIAVPEPDKDISDYLLRFGNRETQRDAVTTLLEKAIVIVQGASVPIRSMREMEECYMRSLAAKNVFTFNRWLPSLGRVVESMELGDLVSLVASTSAGKTCWLQNLAFWSAPVPTLLFEMELAVTTTFNRFVAGAMRMTQAEVKRRYQEKNAIDWWANEDKLSAIFCCNEGGLSVKRMEEIVNRAELKMGQRPTLVLIDYVQLLNGEGRSKYEQITSAMEDLKSLALNTNTIVVCASQRQRPKDERDVEVGLFSGKESGQIENSCQLHLGAWRDNRERDVLWLRVNKNTKGEVGAMIKCNFDGSRMLITEQVKRSPIPADV